MIRKRGLCRVLSVVAFLMTLGWSTGFSSTGVAQPTAQQILYWWQDEIRGVCAELSEARTGGAAEWPRMSVSAGSAVMPVAMAAGPITADGRLDEEAWRQATSFPVGPVFDDWTRGPFMLRVSACRDSKNVYLAIESPRDLDGLGALTPAGELFTVADKPYHGTGRVVELAVPVTGPVSLSFPVEMLRRVDGKLPPAARSLGLDLLATPGSSRDYRKPSLWLEPIGVRLLPAAEGVRLCVDAAESKQGFQKIGPAPASNAETCVSTYTWQKTIGGKSCSIEGFVYTEPIERMLAQSTTIAGRAVDVGSRTALGTTRSELIDHLSNLASGLSAQDRAERRGIYCYARQLRAEAQLSMLDAPLLFVERHPYFAGHIYDDYYTWQPGGGIYVLENPHADTSQQSVHPIVDPTTNETLGHGVYRDPDLSWDADRVLFAFKGEDGNTSLYEIGTDGTGLKRLTDPGGDCRHQSTDATKFEGQHDVTPCYLPDDKIAFTSTRPRALVPCFNSRVDTLHVAQRDGSGIRSISSNNVNEFDPSVLPDGRILYGRWEYVDKTALYMQSLWTVLPDGRMEEALFGNNLAKPTAILDARSVPGSNLVVASLTPHNGQAVGSIAMIDPAKGKNDLAAIFNFTPEYPVEMGQGLRSGPADPWPLSADDVVYTNNAIGAHSIIEMVDRAGNRELVHCDPELSCFAPMLVKPRAVPAAVSPQTEPEEPGRFLAVDVYQGLGDVPRGSVKRLRIVEETARSSGLPPGGRWWNQAFLVSWQGAYIVKNFLGTVPVHEDGSAYFEVPTGRAVYFELLDEEGREVQRMRTFVQAAPGSTRSCVGCHENKKSTPVGLQNPPMAMLGPPTVPEPESWGSGYVDYPTMVQPILDKYCVDCHGGSKGIEAGLDLSGGWTWAFNISYETLIKHRMTGFLNCHNSSVHTAEILPPGSIGSGASSLAGLLIEKYPQVSQPERKLIFAWMDTNSNYYGTWDYTPYATCDAILSTTAPLAAVMKRAGCTECHKAGHVGNDWVNLQVPEWSRILRAPMAKSPTGLGLEFCRTRQARFGYPLVTQKAQSPDILGDTLQPSWDPSGEPHVTIASADDSHYQEMLAIIQTARAEALSRPRVDMPGAEIVPGECRLQVPMPVPREPPALAARLRSDFGVDLRWQRTAEVIGLEYELHRSNTERFTPDDSTQIGLTTAGRFADLLPPPGRQHYAMVMTSGGRRSGAVWTSLDVPKAPEPAAPKGLTANPISGEIVLSWSPGEMAGLRYDVYRSQAGTNDMAKLNAQPLLGASYNDLDVEPKAEYVYLIRAVDRRGRQSGASQPVTAAALAEIEEPVFSTDFNKAPLGRLPDGTEVTGRLAAGAKLSDGALVLGSSGFATFADLPQFEIRKAFSLECWVRIDVESKMPVIAAAGAYNSSGWFLQRFGPGWRWHLAPVNCDGGTPVVGSWTHLVGTFNGQTATLYQDGRQVATVDCRPNRVAFDGPLVIGQYSRQGPTHQLQGAVTGLKIYQRALRSDEIATKHQAGMGK